MSKFKVGDLVTLTKKGKRAFIDEYHLPRFVDRIFKITKVHSDVIYNINLVEKNNLGRNIWLIEEELQPYTVTKVKRRLLL